MVIPSAPADPRRWSFWFAKSASGWAQDVPVHYHGHNDFGMATACAVAAVRAGASWIQGTINGMGERAGNADIGEIALALRCLYDVPVALDLTKVREVSEVVSRLRATRLKPGSRWSAKISSCAKAARWPASFIFPRRSSRIPPNWSMQAQHRAGEEERAGQH